MKSTKTHSIVDNCCLAPEKGKNLYDYYNDELVGNEAASFEEHLVFCFHCQETIFKLDLILTTLRAGAEDRFKQEKARC
jgi:hypothetical protein